LGAQGYTVWQQDLDQPTGPLPSDLSSLSGGTLVWLAPPPREGVDDPRLDHYLPRLLRAGGFRRLLYGSTTGVYGREAEGWLDETTATQPDSDRGRRRLAAETSACHWGKALGVQVIRARIAAIYGPGRLPLRRLQAGQPLAPALAERLANRIHLDDLAKGLLLALEKGRDGAVYHMADGAPAPFGEYLDACADLLGLPRLPRGGNSEDDPAADFIAAHRCIDNQRLIKELGLRLRYPDFYRGLEASIADGRTVGS